MNKYTAENAKDNLETLIDTTSDSHQPILITGKQNNAILISEADWQSIQETLHLLSIPGMKDSIVEGLQTPIEECEEDLDW
ncbi:type II toxin-antitoxin system Phd/YefM family antitoxin [Lyngbya sp. CCY1209]|uniref:type II toxin-antitoxin system Phd/YefM family antitoxin n=1 Tax=Lyngbya sp. CCY1209 TaxID=2886103 RepID=UPI002D201FAB|nr:type II toxin-antitoxin system Phd/YefM family antitoxin [Lyngbya sp. CCY1209]MEB3883818.1 type II toxin-antitoxin system Phd/YefM family antitoxin [Lyngbya sp. CCY1209]